MRPHSADGDEQPRGYVVRSSGSESPSEDEVLAYVAKNMAKVKRITGGIIFVDSVPRNPVRVSSQAVCFAAFCAVTDLSSLLVRQDSPQGAAGSGGTRRQAGGTQDIDLP